MSKAADLISAKAQPGAAAKRRGSSSGGGRMVAGERRQQIVSVAMRVFSERGFRGTTTKEIAQAAGVSEAIIFRHFLTKEDLYTAIIDHKACVGGMTDLNHPVLESIQCSVAEAVERRDDRAVFEGLALAMLRHHAQDPDFLRLLLYSALEGHQLAQMFWDRNVRQMYEFLGGYIRARQRDGALRDVDPTVVVRALSGMIIHHSLNNTLWDKSRRLLDITNEHAAREFTEILLRGVAAPTKTDALRHGTLSKRAVGSVTAARRTKKKK